MVSINNKLFLALASFWFVLSGCSQEGQDQATTPVAEKPQQTVASSPPAVTTVSDPVLIAKGKDLYDQNCVFCHQADAIGKTGVAPSLTNKELLSVSSDKFLKGTIRDGRAGTGMPPFAHLGREGIDAMVAYLRSHAVLENISASVDAQADAHGDPGLGEQWYEKICSTCHGVKGDGYLAGGTGTAIGKAGFLDKATDGFIRTTVKQGRSNTRMLSFQGADGLADLNNQEIDDIITYLRSIKH